MTTDWDLSRRALLKGVGLGAAWLPLVSGGRAFAAGRGKRFICTLQTRGYRQNLWSPSVGPLANVTLPKTTTALEPHKADLIFLPDLANPGFAPGRGLGSYGTIFWGLPDVTGPAAFPEPNGKTVDQVVADALPGMLRRTLALGVQLGRPPALPAPGASHCFWAGPGKPIEPEQDPFVTYQTLFAGVTQPVPDPALKQYLLERKSLLDYVGKSLGRFGKRLGTEDRAAVEAHLQAVREVEQQLTALDGPAAGRSCAGDPPPMIDLTLDGSYAAILSAQMSLMVAALRCGVTQVATLQLSDASGANVNFGAFVPGIPARGTGYKSAFRNWGDLGHNPVLGGVDHKAIVDAWCMAQLAELLKKLKSFPETGGSMLDSCVVLWGNHMQDGANEDGSKIPWILAGRAGGYFKTGQCAASAGKPLTGVLAEICNALGATGHPFGAPIDGLRA
jgi:hypothetical protein